jgi:NTP pyrophosphatase (non-canonical NTP hydrolase)
MPQPGANQAVEKTMKPLPSYRKPAQWDMVCEECAELIQAVLKYRRDPNPVTLANLIEEIADVTIMLEQARLMSDNFMVNLGIGFKMNRLEVRLKRD